MELKNLFEYAPKELTQDGFIRWIFENHGHPEIHGLCADFIRFLTDSGDGRPLVDIDNGAFVRLNSWSQVCHMDVGCDFWFAGDEAKGFCSRYLVIEDKTDSCEHNQLEGYNDSIAKWDSPKGKEGRAIKVFYKTAPAEEDEANRVKNAGWRLVPLDEIVHFWTKYENHPNIIVQFYAKHIMQIGASSKAETKPKENDVVAWLSYFRKTIVPKVEKLCPMAETHCSSNRYGYAYLNVYPKGSQNQLTPYLEFRSRDLLGDSFGARILKYGKDIDIDSFFRLRECIDRFGKLFKANWGQERLQQAGFVPKRKSGLSAADDERLLDAIIRCIADYLLIVGKWREQ